jgi:hypothetical protein
VKTRPSSTASTIWSFSGNAIVSEEKAIDQLSGAALTGKAVVTFIGAPWKYEPRVFGPERMVGKSIEVGGRGASMCLYVTHEFDEKPATPEMGLLRETALVPAAYLPAVSGGIGAVPCVMTRPAVFDRFFGKELGRYDELKAKDETGRAKVRSVHGTIEIQLKARTTEGNASNVVAVLPGTDPKLRDEWVVLTAHYDHLGLTPPGSPDAVYNGADDNASGTAAVLEVARRLAAPKRSVLVLLVSGEERGLLGSTYYALHPLVLFERVVLDVNIDMVGRSSGAVQAISNGSTELFKRAVEAGKAHQVTVEPNAHPTWNLPYLTDSYHFNRLDVPAVEFFTDLHDDYHQPGDEAAKIHYPQLAHVVDAMAQLVNDFAQGAPRPAFKRPSAFLTRPMQQASK